MKRLEHSLISSVGLIVSEDGTSHFISEVRSPVNLKCGQFILTINARVEYGDLVFKYLVAPASVTDAIAIVTVCSEEQGSTSQAILYP